MIFPAKRSRKFTNFLDPSITLSTKKKRMKLKRHSPIRTLLLVWTETTRECPAMSLKNVSQEPCIEERCYLVATDQMAKGLRYSTAAVSTKATFQTDAVMESAEPSQRREMSIRVGSIKTLWKAKDSTFGKMEECMKATGYQIKSTAKVCTSGLMGKFTKVSSKMTNALATVSYIILTANDLKVNGAMERNTARACTSSPTARCTLLSTRKARSKTKARLLLGLPLSSRLRLSISPTPKKQSRAKSSWIKWELELAGPEYNWQWDGD